jgi:hypothetical protein
MLTAVIKAVKMLLSCCPKNSQDAALLAALKAVQDAEKINLPTKTKYRDLFPSVSGLGLNLGSWGTDLLSNLRIFPVEYNGLKCIEL